jgi:hypothetical protein
LVTGGDPRIALDVSGGRAAYSLTGYNPGNHTVVLGANAIPTANPESSADAQASLLAILAHELAHAERHWLGIQRPLLDALLDEAETCIHASFNGILSTRDREDLVAYARDHLTAWIEKRRPE